MKIHIIVAITIMLFSVQYAQAELVTISGNNGNTGIFIAMDGDKNIINFYTEKNNSKHFDSQLKQYKHGSFSLKNTESKIGLWAHLLDNGSYKMTVITNDGIQRIIGKVIDGIKNDEIKNNTPKPVRIEPKSSVGSDIKKYDIPSISRDEGKTNFLMMIKTDRLDVLYLDKDFVFSGRIIDGSSGQSLANADVDVEITRDGFTLMKSSTITQKGGMAIIDFGYLTYPLFYPDFCYDVITTVQYGNNTYVQNDDFKISSLKSYWNPDTSWIGTSSYLHYPEEYKTEPRIKIHTDSKCN